MNTEDKIKVMQAYADGEAIQILVKGEDDVYRDFGEDMEPWWEWRTCKYRIKPKYRPFTREERDQLRNKWVVNKDGREDYISGFDPEYKTWIKVGSVLFTPEHLLEFYTFLDGSPCGVIDE